MSFGRNLINQFNVTYQPWNITNGPIKARGFTSRNRTKLKEMAYPTLALNPVTNGSYREIFKSVFKFERFKHWKDFPTAGAYISHYFSPEGYQYFKDLNDYPYIFSYEMAMHHFVELALTKTLVNGSYFVRPIRGMSALINGLLDFCKSHGARLYSNNEVTHISDSDNGQYVITTTEKSITAKKLVIAIPPKAFKRVKGSKAKTIQKAPEFRALIGIPSFRLGVIYSRAWWEYSEIDGKKLGNLTRYLSNSMCFKLLPYK
jgi:phytoene dehydrogenase-like protein